MPSDRGAFIWYELMTPDATAAKAFYDAVIGWTIDGKNSGPDSAMDYRMIVRSDGGFAGGMLAMTPDMIASGAKPGWYGYVHVPNVDDAVQHLVEAGGAVYMPPHDLEGVGRFAMVADPQGAVLYLMKPTPPAENPDAQSDVFSVDQPQHVRWNELWSSDPEAAVALYGQLFGWTQHGDMDMGPMGKYRFIQHDGVGIGAIGTASADRPGSRWDFYIGVDDVDRAVQAVSDNGGTMAGPVDPIPGGHFSAHAIDSQGVRFGFVGPRK